MMKSLVSTLALWIAATPALSQQPERVDTPIIVVHGTADVRVAPDEATVRLGIVRQANTAQRAQEQANTAAQAILNAIKQLGIAERQIQTSRLTLTPVYAPRSPRAPEAPRIVAYQAANIVSVLISELSRVGPAIDAGLDAGANQLEGVRFGLRNDLSAREEALKQAVTEAQRKAEAIADALNVRLDGVLQVSEGGVSVVPQDFRVAGQGLAAEAASAPVSPGEIEVHANVAVRYRIASRR